MTDQPTQPSQNEELPFEAAFAQLEAIIAELEAGDLPLETALARYERGAFLAALCERKLDEAELRVRLWQPGDATVPVEGWRDENAA